MLTWSYRARLASFVAPPRRSGFSGMGLYVSAIQALGPGLGMTGRLDDEGSAFWLGRLAIRSLLHSVDRLSSAPVYATPPPERLPFHRDLITYFAVDEIMDIIGMVSLTGAFVEGLTTGEATAKRNAYMAGAARVVFRWAFGEGEPVMDIGQGAVESRTEAKRLVVEAIAPLVDLTLDLLGDRSIVVPSQTALSLGGGLMQSAGYRNLLLAGLEKGTARCEGVVFRKVMVVDDVAGEGARGVARIEFH
jgi:hypothetical protein